MEEATQDDNAEREAPSFPPTGGASQSDTEVSKGQVMSVNGLNKDLTPAFLGGLFSRSLRDVP